MDQSAAGLVTLGVEGKIRLNYLYIIKHLLSASYRNTE
jgi:hypothetical protein